VQVDVLGPLRVRVGGREVDLGGPRSRALVARLALSAGRPVGASTLVDDLWGEAVPADAANALQSIVSRTRRRLPDGALDSTAAGYLLHCDGVDAHEFERLASAGRADDALALWRSEPLGDVGDVPFAAAEVRRLTEIRLMALESSLEARVRSDPAVVAELAALTAAHPHRDGLWRLHLTALAAHGRANEALTAYERLRSMLADDLGVDPSPQLQRLHLSILRGEHERHRARSAMPAALTSFVGRDGAIDDLLVALGRHRLVTLLGPGGSGKTRLAVETARRTADRFGGCWLAELAPVTGEDDIVRAVLTAMGLLEVVVLDRPPAATRPDDRARLLEAVRDVDGLLVLDNCEHLVDGVARLAVDLLAHAPDLHVVATSREPLRIIGEYTYQLSPLTMPADGDSVEAASAHSAVQLFVMRAQAVDQSFELDDTTLPAVREICVRLDGQPLAIELAAARLRTLTVGQVAARLSDRFRLLTGGSRTSLPRHRTLRAVVEWSWDLLDEDERRLAESLAVFPGGVTAISAAAVHGDDVEELLESLADKSLLVLVRGEIPRFRMLETLREFGVDRLVERGVADEVRARHLDHFLDVVEAQDARLRSPEQLEAAAILDAEHGNVMAALRYAIDRGDRDRAGRIVAAIAWFWSIRSQHQESFAWATRVLALPGASDPASEIRLEALGIAGVLATTQFDERREARWREPVERVLRLWDDHRPDDPLVHVVLAAMDYFDVGGGRPVETGDDPWTMAMVDLMRMVLLDNSGRLSESVDLIAPTVEAFRAVGDRWGLAMSLAQRATIEALDGDLVASRASWRESMPLLAELGATDDADFTSMRVVALQLALADADELDELRRDIEATLERALATRGRRQESVARMNLAALEHAAGRDEAAVAELEHVLAHRDSTSEFGSGQMEAQIRAHLAVARAGIGDLDGADRELVSAAAVGWTTKDMPVLADVAVAAAVLAHHHDRDDHSARLLGASEVIRGRGDRSNADARRLVDALRAGLGPETYERLHADGASMDQADAVGLLRPRADGLFLP
jgi:predicted ATPase/DNA-binding SARP family transcriptional activator